MYRFIESICCIDGRLKNLEFHQERINRTFDEFYSKKPWQLEQLQFDLPNDGLHKLRFLYNNESFKSELNTYLIKPINSLQVVDGNKINYAFKFLDRIQLNHLYAQRGSADDIIIIRDGLITDSYYANLIFSDGSNNYTPKNPLLAGIKRQKLLKEGKIIEKELTVDDFSNFQSVGLINAMLDPGDITLAVENITF